MKTYAIPALALSLLFGVFACAGSSRERITGTSDPQGHFGYHGPTSLGPMSINAGKYGAVPIHRIWEALDKPSLPPTESICYRDTCTRAYLWIDRGADDCTLVRGIGIAKFKNCAEQPVYPAQRFLHWRTEMGIGLGSTETQVLAAYGSPSTTKIPAQDPRAFLDAYNRAGNVAEMLAAAPHAWRVLRYDGDSDSLLVAEFGIVEEKVVWIWLSDNE